MPTLCSWVSLLCNDISSKGLGIRDCVDIQAFTCLTNTADVSLSHGHDAVVVSRSLSVLLCLQCSMCMTYKIDAVPATLLNTASHCSHSRLLPHHAIRETLRISDVYSLQPRLHTKLLPGQTLTSHSQSLKQLVGCCRSDPGGSAGGRGADAPALLSQDAAGQKVQVGLSCTPAGQTFKRAADEDLHQSFPQCCIPPFCITVTFALI